jgi:mannan endo-1,4-beta-mannosidase
VGRSLRTHHGALRRLSNRTGARTALIVTVALNLIIGIAFVSLGGFFSAAGGPPQGFVVRQGSQLLLDGKPFRFTGTDAYQLATNYKVNIGCGPQPPSVSAMIDSFPAGSVIRFWAFQPMAVNVATHARDWTVLDQVVHAAELHGVKLVMTLSDQSGTCDDGHWHDLAWYQGGYRRIHDDNGKNADVTSWWDWMQEIVTRYADSPAVAYWEPVNEPEASNCEPGFSGTGCYGHNPCPGGNAEALRAFFTIVGGEIHRLDRWHAVASGTLAQGECGLWQQYFSVVGASSGLDVLTVHDYDPALHTGSDQRIAQATALGKPLVYEEVGTDASASGTGCITLQKRATELDAKFRTLLASPIVTGFLPWQWLASSPSTCATAIAPGDPLLQALSRTAQAAG